MKFNHKISVKLVLAGVFAAIAVLIACPAKAELGDTYAQSCRRYGGRGHVYKDCLYWIVKSEKTPTYNRVVEIFYHNQCVMVTYTPVDKSLSYPEGEVWRVLQGNSRPQTIWQSTGKDPAGNPEYMTSDGLLFGKLFVEDSCIRVCYASFLKRHNMFRDYSKDETLPPVEDGGTAGNNSEQPPVEDEGPKVNMGYTGKDWLGNKKALV